MAREKSNFEILSDSEKIIALQKQLEDSKKKIKGKERSYKKVKKLFNYTYDKAEYYAAKATKSVNDYHEQKKIADEFVGLYGQSLELLLKKTEMVNKLIFDNYERSVFPEIEIQLIEINEKLTSLKKALKIDADLLSHNCLTNSLQQLN
jgi:hypothetical protein